MMNKRELEDAIVEKLVEIRELYKSVYPDADYLDMTIRKKSISMSNHPKDDAQFRISYYQSDDFVCREGEYE